MRIRYPNGYECDTQDNLAARIIKKGQAVEVKAEPKTAELNFNEAKKPVEVKAADRKAKA